MGTHSLRVREPWNTAGVLVPSLLVVPHPWRRGHSQSLRSACKIVGMFGERVQNEPKYGKNRVDKNEGSEHWFVLSCKANVTNTCITETLQMHFRSFF